MGENKTQLEELLETLENAWKKEITGGNYELDLDNLNPLTENESNYLIDLGKQFFRDGHANRIWDMAQIYSKGMGHSSESLHLESGCELEKNTLLFGEAHFLAHSIQSIFLQDEEIGYHDLVRMKYQEKISTRVAHLFVTNRRIIPVGTLDIGKRRWMNFHIPIYPLPNGRIWYPTGFDLMDREKFHTIRQRGDKVLAFYGCEYERTVHKAGGAKQMKRGGKVVIVRETGHLDIEFKGEKCVPLTFPKEKPHTKPDSKNRARKLHDQLVIAIGGMTKASGSFNESEGGRLKCPFCSSTYRYSASDVLPDGSIKCQNCMKQFNI